MVIPAQKNLIYPCRITVVHLALTQGAEVRFLSGVPEVLGLETLYKSSKSPGGRIRSVHPIMSDLWGMRQIFGVQTHWQGFRLTLKPYYGRLV